MRRFLILLIVIMWSVLCNAQSETNSYTTYDTAIAVQSDPYHTLNFWLQIRRPSGYFSNDTASKVLMLFSDGDGEQGADTTKLEAYGPQAYFKTGAWSGGITIGNGTHYPIYIKVQTTQASGTGYTSGAFTEPLLKVLVKEFHPRSIHVAGLSHGASQWLSLIAYAGTQGDVYPMQHIQSCVAMQSIGGTADGTQGPFNTPFPACFQTWAKTYGGRYFGIEGTTDLRQTWLVSQAMNAVVPNSGYEVLENDGGGAHCCWVDFYNPFTQWQNVKSPYGNQWIVSSPNNSHGDYIGTGNIYSWMLRQGDTTLVGSASQPVIIPPINSCPVQRTAIGFSFATKNGIIVVDSAYYDNGTSGQVKTGP